VTQQAALLCSEPIRAGMGGIGIRYVEFARHLPRPGLRVVLISPGDPSLASGLPDGVEVRQLGPGNLKSLLRDCSCVVAQGHRANELVTAAPELPTVIDLYDPFLVEHFHYFATLGPDVYRHDHATWMLQMSRGDYFLCASEEQKFYYLGFLTALGRVRPELAEKDPTLDRLIGTVPFGVDLQQPPHRPFLPPRGPGEKRLLFGGLYDWYDPWTVLQALEKLDRPDCVLIFTRNPNPDTTPQRLMKEVTDWCAKRGWLDGRVRIIDWVPADRRYDLLRDVDALVAAHRDTFETRLSFRTRFLDALAAGCPVLTTEGGTLSRLIGERKAGFVLPPMDVKGLARALADLLDGRCDMASMRSRGMELMREYSWNNVIEPLAHFCLNPYIDFAKTRLTSI
jgi:glycosyltransferase involved in cell wall biosynthesis